MISASSALQRLREGNRRFVEGVLGTELLSSPARRSKVAGKQKPFAVILGCSDSRVPGEIVFDQGLGDLFVIRVAGNIVAPSQVGSVEFAVEALDCRLVVVLGHSGCGAVDAALEQLRHPVELHSENLQFIVDRISPSLQPLLETNLADDPAALLDASVKANVQASVSQLRQSSDPLKHMLEKGELLIVGAEYSLETGQVEFFSHSP